MKNQSLVFSQRNIHFEDNERSVVMDIASKSLMEMYSYLVCQNKGNVLDVGFGMGFSANKMSELADTYTCIEINPQVYEKAQKWAEGKDNVNIIFGDWYDIIPKLKNKFDGIFMDTHADLNYDKFEEVSKLIANDDCILSIFNYFTFRKNNTMNFYEYKLDSHKFTKLVSNIHTINWTHFDGNDFVKKHSNKIKFPHPSKII